MGERAMHPMHTHALPSPRTSARRWQIRARWLNREAASTVFRARARAAAPTKSGIFPISKWLMQLDARMSNLFYWMYTLAPLSGSPLPLLPLPVPFSSWRITRGASIRFVPSRESTCSAIDLPLPFPPRASPIFFLPLLLRFSRSSSRRCVFLFLGGWCESFGDGADQ